VVGASGKERISRIPLLWLENVRIVIFVFVWEEGGLLREIGMDANEAFVFGWIKSRDGIPQVWATLSIESIVRMAL